MRAWSGYGGEWSAWTLFRLPGILLAVVVVWLRDKGTFMAEGGKIAIQYRLEQEGSSGSCATDGFGRYRNTRT